MKSTPSGASDAAALRRAFDLSFTEAPRLGAGATEDLLDVRVGRAQYGLRVAEIVGIVADPVITPLPTLDPELLGIAAFRGGILPVYDLRVVLRQPARDDVRWLAVAMATPIGLVFDGLEGHLRVERARIIPHGDGPTALGHVRDVVQVGDVAHPILSIGSMLEALRARVRAGRS